MFTAFSHRHCKLSGLLALVVMLNAAALFAQGPGTTFSFQGKLGDANSPLNGALDMQFRLFDGADPNNSNQVGTTITLNNPLVEVTNGVFTVQLDFGAASLPGADRFLEIGIRRSSSDPYTVLSPRTKISSSPYAVRSLKATGADSLSSACNACIQNSQINSVDASKLTGTIPTNAISASSLPAGSSNYIQNTINQQGSSNFNISGTGVIGSRVAIGLTTPNSRLDVVDAAVQVHFGNSASDSGGYLFSGSASQAIISGGAKWNGSAWVAKSTAASIIENRNGTINFFNNSGLTAGLTFSPTQRMRITPSGDVGIGTSAPAATLDVRGDIKLGPSGEFFDMGSAEKLRMVRGTVNSVGGVVTGTGFTVSRVQTGIYQITFNPTFAEEPTITATPREFSSSSGPYFAIVFNPYAFGPNVIIKILTNTGAPVDSDFYFIAMGSR